MIRYPDMRNELVEYLRCLSDLDYQRRNWVGGEVSEDAPDCLDYSVHFLFDDTNLVEDPKSCVGWILRNEAEARCLESLGQALNLLFHKYGTQLSDETYISLPEWRVVLSASKKALAVLLEDDGIP